MFKRVISTNEVAQQIASLLNTNNRLNTTSSYQQILKNSSSYIVETIGPLVIGCIKIEKQGYTISELKHLCIDKKFRNKGISKILINKSMNISVTPIVYATIRENNIPSQKSFLSCKFLLAGKYTTKDRNVLILLKTCPKWRKTKNIMTNDS